MSSIIEGGMNSITEKIRSADFITLPPDECPELDTYLSHTGFGGAQVYAIPAKCGHTVVSYAVSGEVFFRLTAHDQLPLLRRHLAKMTRQVQSNRKGWLCTDCATH